MPKAKVKNSVKDVDKGWARIMAKVEKLARQQPTLGVGILSTEQHKGSTLSVAEIGAIHEFGTSKIPKRSFLRSTLDEKRIAYQQELSGVIYLSIMNAAKGSGDADQRNFERLGMRIVGDIQRKIARGIPPPNAPSTIARKGSSKPLIDSGQLRKSITYVVKPQQEIRKRAR